MHSDISNTCHKWLQHTAAATYNNGKTIAITWEALKLHDRYDRFHLPQRNSVKLYCEHICSLPNDMLRLRKKTSPLNPEEYGRVTDHTNKILSPRMVAGVP